MMAGKVSSLSWLPTNCVPLSKATLATRANLLIPLPGPGTLFALRGEMMKCLGALASSASFDLTPRPLPASFGTKSPDVSVIPFF